MARAAVYVAPDGRGFFGVTREQHVEVDRTMRRYFVWVESGRKLDPWESYVSGATRFDVPRAKHHRPSSGFGPGKFSEPDRPTDLLRIDDILRGCSTLDNLLFRWHWQNQPPDDRPLKIDEMLDRLNVTLAMYKTDWNRARTKLYFKLRGL